MTRSIALIFVLVFALSSLGQDYTLHIHTSGNTESHSVSSISKLTFDNDSIVVWGPDKVYSLDNMDKVVFSSTSAIAFSARAGTRASGRMRFEASSQAVLFSLNGLSVPRVHIRNAQGRRIATLHCFQGNLAKWNLRDSQGKSIGKGAYLYSLTDGSKSVESGRIIIN